MAGLDRLSRTPTFLVLATSGGKAAASLLAGAAQKAYAEAMNRPSPVPKFVGAVALATAAFLGLFWRG